MALRISDDQARSLGIAEHIPKRVTRSNLDPDGMNKLERKYAGRLEGLKYAGVVRDYWFESLKFRLARKTFLTPDFVVVMADGSTEIHETKGGFYREDARVKTKIAAEKYWYMRWLIVRWVDRNWEFEIIPGRNV